MRAAPGDGAGEESDQHLNNYRPGGGGSGGKGYQGSRPGQGTTPKHAHARTMENMKELFWCDARDEQGHLQHASDCEQRDCFVVQGNVKGSSGQDRTSLKACVFRRIRFIMVVAILSFRYRAQYLAVLTHVCYINPYIILSRCGADAAFWALHGTRAH